jgi:hypothetical protein
LRSYRDAADDRDRNPVGAGHRTKRGLTNGVAAGVASGRRGRRCAARALRPILATVLLFGISPQDPETIDVACVSLIAAAVVAAYQPARRAANLDPLKSLRSEQLTECRVRSCLRIPEPSTDDRIGRARLAHILELLEAIFFWRFRGNSIGVARESATPSDTEVTPPVVRRRHAPATPL